MDKFQIRKKILKIRKKKLSNNFKINLKLLIKIFKKNKIEGKILGGYYPYNYEIDPLVILSKFENSNYTIALPKIQKNYQMDFFGWSTNDPLTINSYGIPEPISEKIIYPDILLVPLVAFDLNKNRIGYGGGFYDRYLKRIKKIKKVTAVGLAYSFQKVNKIPNNQHDIKLDYIITDKGNF